MARSSSRSGGAADTRVTAAAEHGEPRELHSEPRELSLEEVLKSYEQPINEEQAWAVCYQCCSGLRLPRPPAQAATRVKDPSSILLHRDGTVWLRPDPRNPGRCLSALKNKTRLRKSCILRFSHRLLTALTFHFRFLGFV